MLFTVNEDLEGHEGIVGNGLLQAPSVRREAHSRSTRAVTDYCLPFKATLLASD